MEILLILFTSVILLFAFKLGSRLISKKSSASHRLPPGPWKLPLIGNMHNLIGDVPHRLLHQLAQKHGPLMQLQLGEVSVVVVSSAGAAKEVMKTHDLNFSSRPPILAAEIMSYGCTSISFSPHGDYWRQLRKICTLELLSSQRVQSFRSLREKVYLDLIKWIADMEGLPLNLTERLYSSTYSYIAMAALGKEPERLWPMIKESLELASGFDIAEVYPSLKMLRMMSGMRRRLIVLHRETDRILEGVIQEHRLAAAMGGDSKDEDLVDVLLKFQDTGSGIPLTPDNIKSVILVTTLLLHHL